jgi:hypothetical protein
MRLAASPCGCWNIAMDPSVPLRKRAAGPHAEEGSSTHLLFH